MQAHELPSHLPELDLANISNSWQGVCLTTATVQEKGKCG